MSSRFTLWFGFAAMLIAGIIMLASGCTSNSGAYRQWAPSVRPSVKLIAERFNVRPTTYPGHDPDMEHAADFMVYTDTAKGYQIAEYAVANARKLHVHYVGWHEHIWNIQRAGEGWRWMADRGSPTANHMDHVHISFY